ncbi:hypothetical protein Tco_0050970, partial [Tanacetum coccineum]
MINRHVTEALETREANRNIGLGNSNDEGGTSNGNGNRNGNGNHNENDRDTRPVVRECTYQDFMKCQPLNFKGTKGVVGLIRWFQELTMMCTKMVPGEEDQVEKLIGGLPNNIQGNVVAAETTRLQDAIRIANHLMDKKLKGYAVRNAENKRRLENNYRDNCGQQPPHKRQNTRGQNVARAYTAGNNEKRGYGGILPFCNRAVIATTTQGTPGPNQRVITCFECGALI